MKVFCVEHFIEGNYVKYNSNSGFVSELHRLTPHVSQSHDIAMILSHDILIGI